MQARCHVKTFIKPVSAKGLVSTYRNKPLQLNKKINNPNLKSGPEVYTGYKILMITTMSSIHAAEWLKLKSLIILSTGEIVEELDLLCFAVDNLRWCSHFWKCRVSSEVTQTLALNPSKLPHRNLPKGSEMLHNICRKITTQRFTAPSFILAKMGNQKSISGNAQINCVKWNV